MYDRSGDGWLAPGSSPDNKEGSREDVEVLAPEGAGAPASSSLRTARSWLQALTVSGSTITKGTVASDHDFTDNPDIGAQRFRSRVRSHQPRRLGFPRTIRGSAARRYFRRHSAHGLRDPEGAAINPRHRRALGDRSRTSESGSDRDRHPHTVGTKNYGWPGRLLRARVQYDFQRTDGRKNDSTRRERSHVHARRGRSGLFLGARYRRLPGMLFYTGDKFPAWKGNLFIG